MTAAIALMTLAGVVVLALSGVELMWARQALRDPVAAAEVGHHLGEVPPVAHHEVPGLMADSMAAVWHLFTAAAMGVAWLVSARSTDRQVGFGDLVVTWVLFSLAAHLSARVVQHLAARGRAPMWARPLAGALWVVGAAVTVLVMSR